MNECSEDQRLIDVASSFLMAYRERKAAFGSNLFHSPGWEILLLLRVAGGGLSPEQIVSEIEAPKASVMRWLSVLENEGLVLRKGMSKSGVYVVTNRAVEALRISLAPAVGNQNNFSQKGIFNFSRKNSLILGTKF